MGVKKAIVGPPPPHPGSSPSLADDKPRLCLGKVQCYISDLSDPKTPGMEGKKKPSIYHYSLHIQANIYLKHPNTTVLVYFPLSLSFLAGHGNFHLPFHPRHGQPLHLLIYYSPVCLYELTLKKDLSGTH